LRRSLIVVFKHGCLPDSHIRIPCSGKRYLEGRQMTGHPRKKCYVHDSEDFR
jgi:hypothetical protein